MHKEEIKIPEKVFKALISIRESEDVLALYVSDILHAILESQSIEETHIAYEKLKLYIERVKEVAKIDYRAKSTKEKEHDIIELSKRNKIKLLEKTK